nr:ABCA5 protein [Diaphanosoma celebensis]
MEGRMEPVTAWAQLGAMVRRNLLLKKREWKKTLAECVVPLWFLAILIVINTLLPNPNYGAFVNETGTVPIAMQFIGVQNQNLTEYPLYIVPNNSDTRQFADEMNEHWLALVPPPFSSLIRDLNFVFLDSEDQLEQVYFEDPSNTGVHLAVIFDEDPWQNMSYTIRNNPNAAPLPGASLLYGVGSDCRNKTNMTLAAGVTLSLEFGYLCPINHYYYSDFLAVQSLVEITWLMRSVDAADIPDHLKMLTYQLFPKPPYVDDVSLQVMRFLIPFYMVLTLSQFILYLLTLIVGEKEKKIKESLRMMGLRDSIYWLSWLVVYLIFVVCLDVLATVILYALGVFTKSNVGLIFLLFLLFDLSVLALAFFLTPFFDKARVAGLFGAMAVAFLNLFYYIQVATGDQTADVVYWLLSLIAPTGFALGMDKALLLEISTDEGVQLSTLWDGPGLPMAGSFIMLAVDVVLYILLTYYLDSVLPSEYGARKSPWFCLSPSFWCGKSQRQVGESWNAAYEPDGSENVDMEPMPPSLRGKEAVKIRGLSKTFQPFGKPKMHAVKGLNLDVYEGQITAILGHNGAGKTTLFNMLTGMTSPSAGTALIYGYDINDANERHEIRRMTGVCPQHDVLFDQLTPREHLRFFGRIRGIPADRLDAEVERTLKDIDLSTKGDSLAGKLSGGQKRKLSIGIALIGDPKIIFLDEPTAGVDPYSRRHLWNLLQERKAGKVILLTTHFMDEADLLADRKAIVTKGQLRCLGSSLFLKNKFGIGYHLTFVMDENFHDTAAIRSLVQRYVPDAQLNRHFGRELSFVLPRAHVDKFPALFTCLESYVNEAKGGDDLGFTSYGVSMTTLEEVFLKLGEEAEMEAPQSEPTAKDSKLDDRNATWQLLHGLDVPIRRSHRGQTLRALLKIRGLNMMRDPMAVFFQVFMPVAFAALGIWLGTLQAARTNEDKRPLNLDVYANDTAPPLLFMDDAAGSLASFWRDLTDYAGVDLQPYDGNYQQLVNESVMPHWAAMDTLNSLDMAPLIPGWNLTSNLTIPLANLRMRFNDTLLHMPPIVVNAITNTLLRRSGRAENVSLSVHPLPYVNPPGGFDPGQFSSAMFIGMLFVLAPSALACEIVLDREVHAKNLLRVNGLSFGMYFGSFFIVLGSMMVTTCLLIVALIFAFQLTSLITPTAIGLLALMYVLYCPAAILFAACASYLFDSMETAQSVFPNVSSLIGFVPYIVVMLCDMFQVGGSADIATTLHIVFCCVDTLYIPYGILYFINRVYFQCLIVPHGLEDVLTVCGELGWSEYMNVEVIVMIVALLVHIPIYFCLLVVIDVKKSGGLAADAFPPLRSCLGAKEPDAGDAESSATEAYRGKGDSDVRDENVRVQRLLHDSSQQPVVLIHGLGKTYASAESGSSSGCRRLKQRTGVRPAVKSLSFAVKAGEVFGLLGHNGAGKTTTMKIITAEEAPSLGRVRVAGHDITSNLSAAFKALGYCPQHDALWRNITVREHLEAYAAIRGIEPAHIDRVVNLFLRGLQIEQHAGKLSKNCSGGTRRKLSYAVSMLGRPAIVLMDEPSTGMDPQSKRFLWNTISASFQGQRGAILTTHSMEEADALCSRVGIMVKGRTWNHIDGRWMAPPSALFIFHGGQCEMRCLGTSQHLKNRYGNGYVLEIKLKSLSSETSGSASAVDVAAERVRRKEKLTDFVRRLFRDALIEESFEDRLIFGLAQENVVSLADTFNSLEGARDDLSIEEYSLSQTTLEQVFIRFAHEQEAVDQDED